MPILTPEQIRLIRQKKQWTQEELATVLGWSGDLRRQRVSRLERGADEIDSVRANLLLAIDKGYEPVDENGEVVIEAVTSTTKPTQLNSRRYTADPKKLTTYQASALHAALHRRGRRFFTNKNRQTMVALARAGLINGYDITEDGDIALSIFKADHAKLRFN